LITTNVLLIVALAIAVGCFHMVAGQPEIRFVMAAGIFLIGMLGGFAGFTAHLVSKANLEHEAAVREWCKDAIPGDAFPGMAQLLNRRYRSACSPLALVRALMLAWLVVMALLGISTAVIK
jgi:hypothetical protein